MKGFYRTLKDVELPSCYKVASITRACAVIQSRKKGENRGVKVGHPRPLKAMVCTISGFIITMKGRLFVPLGRDKYFDVQLNRYVLKELGGRKARSPAGRGSSEGERDEDPDPPSRCQQVDSQA